MGEKTPNLHSSSQAGPTYSYKSSASKSIVLHIRTTGGDTKVRFHKISISETKSNTQNTYMWKIM